MAQEVRQGALSPHQLPPRRPSYNSYRPRRSISDMMSQLPSTPQWQPDEDVTKCSACEQEFSIFFRKHHCRKCGRVVCSDCSRHRITLPQKYIVQPPWIETSSSELTGGASVRVCNPCVPDPWTPQQAEPRPAVSHRYSMPPSPAIQRAQSYFQPQHAQRRSFDASQRTNRNSFVLQSPLTPFYQPQNISTPRQQTVSDLQRRNFPLPPRPTASSPRLEAPLPRPPRRIVKEEDECPVCGIELEPGAEGREQHITDCISSRFSTVDPGRSTPTAATLDISQASPSTPPPNRIRAQSYRSRGLYSYKATEKDCLDNEGSEQECPICFEEFQPGDTLGRLECLCRFHHSCIREWWARKGPGMCPVHASHE